MISVDSDARRPLVLAMVLASLRLQLASIKDAMRSAPLRDVVDQFLLTGRETRENIALSVTASRLASIES